MKSQTRSHTFSSVLSPRPAVLRKVLLGVMLLPLLVVLTGCLGPKPVVLSHTDQPPAAGSDQPYKVEVVVKNEGLGGGQVAVTVNLKNKQTGETIKQEEKDVELEKDETQHVDFELSLPGSAQSLDPKEIEVDVEANYPIE